MVSELGIAAFKVECAHILRAALNTLLFDTVPEVVRAAFGFVWSEPI